MNKKYKIAIAATLATTSIAYSTSSLFAQNEPTISEHTSIDTSDIDISSTNFPDSVFRQHIRDGYFNENGVNYPYEIKKDGILTISERASVRGSVIVSGQNIKSLKGIEHFPFIQGLYCDNTGITELDISKNASLKSINCSNTGLTKLNVSNHTALTSLDCSNTRITELDVSNNTALTSLSISNNNLAWLHIGNNSNLGITNNTQSRIHLGKVDRSFNIQEVFPGIDANRIQSINGANLDKNTGIVSGYVAGTPITYAYNCGTAATGTYLLNVTLNFEVKAPSSITINDDLNKVYDGTAVVNPINITKTGSTGLVSFEWYAVDGTKLPVAPVNAGSYKIKAILAGDTNYVGAEVEKEFTITKANSTITIDDDLNKVYDGQAVIDPVNLTKTGSTGAVTFEWYMADGTQLQTAPENAGSYKVKAILASDENFLTTEVEKEFEITKASSNIIINDDLNKVYDGQTVVEPNVTKAGSTGAVTFEWCMADGTPLQTAPVNVGSYKVKAILADDVNHVGAEVEKEFTIAIATSTIIINNDLNKAYDGTVVEPSVTTTGSTGSVIFEWYTTDGTKLQESPINVGSYKVKAILADDANHIGAVVEKEFTITKANSTIIINDDLNKIYDGTAVVEPTVTKIGSTGAVSIEWYTADGTPLTSAPVNAGSYKVKAILTEDTNYAGIEVEKEFTISQATSSVTITVELDKVYDGQSVIEPQVSVTGSTGAITYEWYKKEESTTRTTTWTKLATAPSEVGNYKVVVTVAGDGNFEAVTVEKEFSILGKEVVPTPGTGGGITNPDGTEGPEINLGDKVESNGPVITNPDGSITFPNGGTIIKPDGSVEVIKPGATLTPNKSEIVPTPGVGGGITNPDGTEGPEINPGDKVESNGPVITNPDGSIIFPNGGIITKPDGSVVIIQPGATLKPNDQLVEGTTTIPGVQTGDGTQVGLWTMLVGLSTGMMMFFRRKNRKEEA